jgi:hypothetical protein
VHDKPAYHIQQVWDSDYHLIFSFQCELQCLQDFLAFRDLTVDLLVESLGVSPDRFF